ncbi:MAG: transglutaminase family protein [Acetatifactor sp.]
MKHLIFDYDMQIDYSVAVSRCNYTIKCIPQNTMRQRIEKIAIDLFPKTNYSWGMDGLKNRQIYGMNEEEHNTFCFHISGDARTGLAEYEEIADDSMAMIFRHPHGLNVAGEGIRTYFEKISQEIMFEKDAYAKAIRIMHRLYGDYRYQANMTTINTTAEEAFLLGQGVCQDYAHIFIALLHLAGVPARYVTGLMIGEGASHAWVEVLHNGMWYGLDPTNDKLVLSDYIKIGVGRDAGDCMINRGIMHGGGLHTQKIKAIVKEMDGRNYD